MCVHHDTAPEPSSFISTPYRTTRSWLNACTLTNSKCGSQTLVQLRKRGGAAESAALVSWRSPRPPSAPSLPPRPPDVPRAPHVERRAGKGAVARVGGGGSVRLHRRQSALVCPAQHHPQHHIKFVVGVIHGCTRRVCLGGSRARGVQVAEGSPAPRFPSLTQQPVDQHVDVDVGAARLGAVAALEGRELLRGGGRRQCRSDNEQQRGGGRKAGASARRRRPRCSHARHVVRLAHVPPVRFPVPVPSAGRVHAAAAGFRAHERSHRPARLACGAPPCTSAACRQAREDIRGGWSAALAKNCRPPRQNCCRIACSSACFWCCCCTSSHWGSARRPARARCP